MRTTAISKAFFLAGALLLGAGVGCSDRNHTYPFFELDWDTDSETDTDTDTETGSDGDGDMDTDGDTDICPDDYTDDLDRCIRYVDWESTATICGTSWEDAFTNLQDGIESAYAAAQALGGCEVWVAEGTYRSYVAAFTDTFYLRTDVQVYGGFRGDELDRDERDIEAHETILDGRDELELNASYHVVMGAERGELDGFTITGGLATGATPHHRGGGLYSNATNTIVRNCTFRGNRAIDGGAVFLYDNGPEDDNPRLEDCLLEENTAENGGAVFVLNGGAEFADVVILHTASTAKGGGVYLKSVYGDCYPTFDNTSIESNTAQTDGGGVFVENCHPELIGSMVVDNTAAGDGGGVSGERGSAKLEGAVVRGNKAYGSGGGLHSFRMPYEISGSRIVGNSAADDGGGMHLSWSDSAVEASLIAANTAGRDGGGVFVQLDFPRFANNLITGNSGERGGGAFNGERAVATYVNTVFHGNRASEIAAGVFNADLSEVDLFNDIAYGDFGTEIYDEKGSDTEVAYCDVQGGYDPGIQIIDVDPMFTAPGTWIDPGTPDDASDDEWSYGDYHLQAGSPCIDQADDSESPDEDADGHDWIDIADAGLPDVAADIGAYDYQL